MPRIKSGYLPELDGLRALAILAVLIFHLQPSLLPGGFLGVDVFFVISGFLITRLITPQIAEGRFSFKQFYLRRAKRLLPVFFLVLLLTWVAAWWLLFPSGLASLSKSSFAALLSFSNYQFARGTGYFEPQAESNPLLHTWSLAVEEQFYLLFPLLFVLTWQKLASWRTRTLGLAAVLGGLFLLSSLMTYLRPGYAFYALESRAWELGIGCLAAFIAEQRQLPSAAGIVGLLLCLTSFVTASASSAMPVPTALMPTLGAALLILSRCGGEATGLHRAAILAPVAYLGRISYSLYLFHWPVIVFYKESTPNWSGLDQVICAGLATLLAVITHHLWENPVRHATNPLLLRRLGYAGLVFFISLGIGSKYVRKKDGYIGAASEVWLRKVHPDCDLPKPPTTKWMNIGVKAASPEIMLLGDSHAQCLVPSLDEALQQQNLSGAYWIAPGTLPAVGVKTSEHSEKFDQTLQRIANSPVRVVILCSKWLGHLKSLPRAGSQEKPTELQQQRLAGLTKTITTLTQAGKKLIIVHPIPAMTRHVPHYMAYQLMTGRTLAEELTTPERYLTANEGIMDFLKSLQPTGSIQHVFPHELMLKDGCLPYHEKGLALYEDVHHVTRLGAERIVRGLMPLLESGPKAAR